MTQTLRLCIHQSSRGSASRTRSFYPRALVSFENGSTSLSGHSSAPESKGEALITVGMRPYTTTHKCLLEYRTTNKVGISVQASVLSPRISTVCNANPTPMMKIETLRAHSRRIPNQLVIDLHVPGCESRSRNAGGMRTYSTSNFNSRKNPYETTPLSAPVRAFLFFRRYFFRFFSLSLYYQTIAAAPPYKRHFLRFFPIVVFFIFVLVYAFTTTVFDKAYNPRRGQYFEWNGEVDNYWREVLPRYFAYAMQLYFSSILGGRTDDKEQMDLLSSIFQRQRQGDLNADLLLYVISHFKMPSRQTLHVDGEEKVVHFSKEQNKRYEDFLEKVYMNINHSFPLFLMTVFLEDPKELLSMCRFLRKRLNNDLLHGESIIMPLYTQANISDNLRGPHRAYLSFQVKDGEEGKRLVDISIYDTKTIHWTYNPEGMNHHDKRGFVRVDYPNIPLDDNFHKKMYSFLLQVERFPNGSYRESAKNSPLRNFADYKNIAVKTFGRVEVLCPEKRKLQIYDTGAWEGLEKILRDWSNGDDEVYYRFKLDFRKTLHDSILNMVMTAKYENLMGELLQKQIHDTEAKVYRVLSEKLEEA